MQPSLAPTEIIVVNLASNEDFERVGVERFFFLTEPASSRSCSRNDNGNAVRQRHELRKPITEPYLNFLVEVLWPQGRLLKEYTLLLDPPTYSQAAAPAVERATRDTADASTGRVQRTPAAPPPSRASSGTQVQLGAGAPAAPRRDESMTTRDDTLWQIANRNLPSGRVSVNQNMLAIQRLNPDAFIRDNINLLKAGFVLRMPDEQEALKLSAAQASAEVTAQMDDWRAFARGESPARAADEGSRVADADSTASQVDATAPKPASAAAQEDQEGQLRIVAGEGDSAQGGEETAAEVTALQEENDRLNREVEELSYQFDRDQEISTNQLAVKDRQLEVKNQELAEMQEQLAAAREEMDRIRREAGAQSQPAAEVPIWMSPTALIGGLSVLVVGLVIALFVMRKRRQEAEEAAYLAGAAVIEDSQGHGATHLEPSVGESAALAEPIEELDDALADADEALDEFASTDTIEVAEVDDPSFADEVIADEDLVDISTAGLDGADALSVDEPEPAEAVAPSKTTDVIAEADIYVAYERYPQAIGLLTAALEEDPARHDVRLKLLETYVETEDRASFDAQMKELIEVCEDQDVLLAAREIESQAEDRLPTAIEDLSEVAEQGLTAESAHENGAALDFEGDATLDDFDVQLDELDAEAPAATSNGSAELDDFDFELEIEGDSAVDATPSTADDDYVEIAEAETDNNLGGDLGIDFDPETDVATTEELAAVAAEEPVPTLETASVSEDDFDFGDDGSSADTKLDLAQAYIEMGDEEGARDILGEVVQEGDDGQRERAQGLLDAMQ